MSQGQISFSFPLGTSYAAVMEAIKQHYGRWQQLEAAEQGLTDSVGSIEQTRTLATDVTHSLPTAQHAPLPIGAVEQVEDVDAEGIPWDERIHSSARGDDGKPVKNDDGRWKMKRGASNAASTVAIKAELLSKRSQAPQDHTPVIDADVTLAGRVAAANQAGYAAAGTPALMNPAQVADALAGRSVEFTPDMYAWFQRFNAAFGAAMEGTPAATPTLPGTPAGTPTLSAPVAMSPAQDPNTFIGFTIWSAKQVTAKRFTSADLNTIIADLGIADATGKACTGALKDHVDMIPHVHAMLDALYPVA